MKALGISLFLIVFSYLGIHAQHLHNDFCGSHTYIDVLDSLYPGLKKQVDNNYLTAVRNSKNDLLLKADPIDTIFTIPVVFHILWNNSTENLDEELIISQLADMNAAFNRENSDTINTREIFLPVAGSARIRFVLASKDPSGNSTNGIHRVRTNLSTFGSGSASQTLNADRVKFSSLGGTDAWNTDKYLNIWICDISFGGRIGLLGYAFPPVNADFWQPRSFVGKTRQGVVLHYQIVGKDNPSGLSRNLYTMEKTAIHEVGHFLGLRHTWGDAFTNGCAFDDFIDDTPATIRASRNCNKNQNTCNSDDLPDQIENYMDYASAFCSNMFTKQQVQVMRYNLENLRESLSEKEVVYPPIYKPDIDETKFFPNPFGEILSVYLDSIIEEESITITLTDLLGRKVLQYSYKSTYAHEQASTGLSIGYYHASIYSNIRGEILVSKLVKIQ